MKFAYADPPYIGQAARHYNCDEVDHAKLIQRLVDEFPDGWALSLSSTTLRKILPFCPANVRIASWCKSFCAFKRGVRPRYAWEPIIFMGGRNPMNGYKHAPPLKNGKQNTPKDFLVEPITMKKGLTGAKPAKVCARILDLLNFQHGEDLLHDLFPGTGGMGTEIFRQCQDFACGKDGCGGYVGYIERHAVLAPLTTKGAGPATL